MSITQLMDTCRSRSTLFVLVLVGLCGTACGDPDAADKDSPASEAGDFAPSTENAEADPMAGEVFSSARVPTTPIPVTHGLYHLNVEGALDPVRQGDVAWLDPTNGVQGFGMASPRGPIFTGDQRPTFVLWSGSLNLATLRITRFVPDALLPAGWWRDPPEEGRYGWMPHSMVRILVESIEGHPSMVRFQPLDPLAPGLYIVHDGSVTRGYQREDISRFYAFQIAPTIFEGATPSPSQVWFEQAMPCVRDIEQALVDAHVIDSAADDRSAKLDREVFSSTQAERIRRCAAQIYAVMAASQDIAITRSARATLISLETLAHGPSWTDMQTVLESTAQTYESAPMLYYWLELEALDMAHATKLLLAKGDKVAASGLASKLAALYLDTKSIGSSQSGQVLLSRIIWPLYFIDPEWARLGELTELLVASMEPYERAAELVAAHRTARLEGFRERFPHSGLGSLVEASIQNVRKQYRDAAASLDVHHASTSSVVIGQVYTHPGGVLSEGLKLTINTWIGSKKGAVQRCFDELQARQPADVQGIWLVRITFATTMLSAANTVELIAPSDELVGAPLGDSDFKVCLQDAVNGLPSDVVPLEAELTVPLVFNGNIDSRNSALIR